MGQACLDPAAAHPRGRRAPGRARPGTSPTARAAARPRRRPVSRDHVATSATVAGPGRAEIPEDEVVERERGSRRTSEPGFGGREGHLGAPLPDAARRCLHERERATRERECRRVVRRKPLGSAARSCGPVRGSASSLRAKEAPVGGRRRRASARGRDGGRSRRRRAAGRAAPGAGSRPRRRGGSSSASPSCGPDALRAASRAPRPEAVEARPERGVRIARHLRLQPDQMVDSRETGSSARRSRVPLERRSVRRPTAQDFDPTARFCRPPEKGLGAMGWTSGGIVVYIGAKWETRSGCIHVLRRIRAHDRRQEPAHAPGPLPRRSGRRRRAHARARRVPRRLRPRRVSTPWSRNGWRRSTRSPRRRDLKRFFFSAASDAELDKQGRVLVPPALHRHAKLGREVVVAGVHDHLEIWDRGAWAAHVATVEGSADDVAERLAQARLITSRARRGGARAARGAARRDGRRRHVRRRRCPLAARGRPGGHGS